MSSHTVLSQLALNRALLARQMLLKRSSVPVADMIEHLVAMQAQVPSSPYVGLWTRLNGFHPEGLADLIARRRAVRIALLRSTIHLVTARDCLGLRPLIQPALERTMQSNAFGRAITGIDRRALLAAARALLEEKPRSHTELGMLLQKRWPDRDAMALGLVIRTLLPLVQVPPRGIWGATGPSVHTTAEAWLGRPLQADPSLDTLIQRYLKAFGPATVGDMQAWSGLSGLRPAVERLRSRLRTFKDERGRELFDVLDGPLPDPDTPAPPRFLPEYDNLLLAHADRTRVIPDKHRGVIFAGTVLVEGFVRGTWAIKRLRSGATLTVKSFEPLSKKDRTAVAQEGDRLLTFAAADAITHDVRVEVGQ